MAKSSKKATTKEVSKDELFKKVKSVVDKKIRPLLQSDGGDMDVIKLHDNGTLDVELVGACQGCPSAAMTLSFGVQQIIDSEFPEENIQINPI